MGAWGWLATPLASVVAGLIFVAILIRLGYHRNRDGTLSRRRIARVVILSSATYTFLIGASSDLFFHGPDLSAIIKFGFGDERVSWLLLGVIYDGVTRIWEEFGHPM